MALLFNRQMTTKSAYGLRQIAESDRFATDWLRICSLRSRRLEVVGERENGRARGRHARGEGAPLPLPSRVSFSRTRFFLGPLLPRHDVFLVLSPPPQIYNQSTLFSSRHTIESIVLRLLIGGFVFCTFHSKIILLFKKRPLQISI